MVHKLSKGLQAPTCIVPKGRVFFQTSNQQPSTPISASATHTVCGISDSLRTTVPFLVPANNTIWNCHQSVTYNHLQTEDSVPIADPHDSSNGAQPTGSVPLAAKIARLCSSRRSATFATFASSSSLSNTPQCSSSSKNSPRPNPRCRRASQNSDSHKSSVAVSQAFGYFLGTLNKDALSRSDAASTIESILNSIPKSTVSQVFEDQSPEMHDPALINHPRKNGNLPQDKPKSR
ncbi:hypothetical protein QAD02_020653 [Eretmocerus hayati]|uniref:Uncharacterized protein n=1 Tax=Eretmocerus hayati TaxID=131215 RepID=A0ACC2PN48_9HYME|nr:hypothetical protein QAD02_020653 [Eretmocerus hayati]